MLCCLTAGSMSPFVKKCCSIILSGRDMRLICFNIGWMERYDGSGTLISGFKYVRENKTGEEISNFVNRNGYCYGNVPVRYRDGQSVSLHLERIGASKKAVSVEGVTVVFFARHPERQVACVVGWYRNAVVYRKEQREILDGQKVKYSAKARAEDCVCLKVHERSFAIPSGHVVKGGYGQGTMWYADADAPAIVALRKHLEAYLRRHQSLSG